MGVLLLKGLFIGILSSAPMGPVGMLCIQRTLNNGKKSGRITGLGAAVGDTLYALITLLTMLGLSFIGEYIEEHHIIFQAIGSLILIIFGYFVGKQNPSKNITQISKDKIPFGKNFGIALFLTLSNVGMLFFYMALFTRFKLIDTSVSFGFSFFIILAIGVGAMSWWLFITFLVNKLRKRFNPRGLKTFNRVVGSILIGIGIFGIVASCVMAYSSMA